MHDAAYCNQNMDLFESRSASWTAWCYHPAAKPVLISDWNGTRTPEGDAVYARLRLLQ